MALIVPPVIGHGGSADSNITAAARTGTTITAHATPHTKGSWTSLIDPTTRPSYGLCLQISEVRTNTTDTSMLVDIAYGPTGGGNEQIVLPDLNAGQAGLFDQNGGFGKLYLFPVYIPTGVRISARSQAAVTSDTCLLSVFTCADPLYPNPAGGVLAYGIVAASSRGTSVTPGSGAFGAWTQLSAGTTRAHRYWSAGLDLLGNTAIASASTLVQLGVGPDASNVSVIYQGIASAGSSEAAVNPWPLLWGAPVPAAALLWARVASGNTTAIGVSAYGVD